MTDLTVTVDLNNCVTADDVLREFTNFANIVTVAINKEHAKASKQEELGITAGRYAREAIENICNTISMLMPVDADNRD